MLNHHLFHPGGCYCEPPRYLSLLLGDWVVFFTVLCLLRVFSEDTIAICNSLRTLGAHGASHHRALHSESIRRMVSLTVGLNSV